MATDDNAPAVLVVGAGPTGLMMAGELARHGVSCRIIDKLPEPTTTSKAFGLHSRTLEIFEQLGMLEEALSLGHTFSKISIYANDRPLIHLSLDHLRTPYPFVLSLPQSETERILNRRLHCLGVEVERELELLDLTQNDRAVIATLRHADGRQETVTVSWLIGCDGPHSSVRRALNIPFTGAPYPGASALADVRLQGTIPDDAASISFQQNGLLAIFPMRGGRHRLVVETAEETGEEKLPDQLLEEIQGYLTRFGAAGSIVGNPDWLTLFRTHLRHAAQTRQGRVFLAGDAAHIHNPAGGQGMNTGLQDAYNLAWKLALVHKGHAFPALLDTYQIERQPVARSVMRISDLLLKIATLRSPIAQQLRSRLLPLLVRQSLIQQRITAQIAGLRITYRKSPIVAKRYTGRLSRGHFNGGPRAGDSAPDAGPLLRADGTATRLFEALRGTTHMLLLLADAANAGAAQQRLAALADAISARYSQQITCYLVVAGAQAPSGIVSSAAVLLDPEHALRQSYGVASECLYLIRPDGYIALRSASADAAGLNDYLQRVFC